MHDRVTPRYTVTRSRLQYVVYTVSSARRALRRRTVYSIHLVYSNRIMQLCNFTYCMLARLAAVHLEIKESVLQYKEYSTVRTGIVRFSSLARSMSIILHT